MEVKSEEQVTRELYRCYIESGIEHQDALERLVSVLACEPAMFTRMVPVIDELRNEVEHVCKS